MAIATYNGQIAWLNGSPIYIPNPLSPGQTVSFNLAGNTGVGKLMMVFSAETIMDIEGEEAYFYDDAAGTGYGVTITTN